MFLKSSGEDKGELLSFDDLFARALYDPPGIAGSERTPIGKPSIKLLIGFLKKYLPSLSAGCPLPKVLDPSFSP
jgi:hypothetical protein